ncbi:MAG: hypothetical protein U0R26_12160 [Solirubrobacterales bacterium]
MERIAAFLSLSFERAEALAGGETAEEVRSSWAIALQAQTFPEPGSPERKEADKKSGATRAGRAKPEAAVTAMLATRAAKAQREGHDPALDALAAHARSVGGRALAILRGRLVGCPRPPRDQLTSWAASAAEQLGSGITVKAVDAIWSPYLVRRGLRAPGGRPKVTGRLESLLALMAELGVDPARPIPTPFWEAAVDRLRTTEAKPPQSEETVRRWWQTNKPR